jgi:radical SAM superfamily enzyme YgiQ (UPF0313 family)
MKILLLQLNYDAHIIHPPLGLGYLASSLRDRGHIVSIFDGTLNNAKDEDYLDSIKEFGPDLIGITVLSRGHNMAKHLVSIIKNKFNIPIVLGGPQVSAYPIEIYKDFKPDFCIVGEGEMTVCELIEAIQGKMNLESIKGLVYSQNGVLKKTSPRELISNLDSISPPAWDLMSPSKYRIAPILAPAKAFPIAPILTTRGCPYQCTFCATNVTWKRKIRRRSVKNVIDEIEMLIKRFGVREIHLSDDNFTLIRKHVEDFCNGLKERKINISWQCPNGVRVDTLDIKLLKKMKESGCYALGLGIESGNRNILKRIKKNLNLDIVKRVLSNMKKVGISSYGFFILGLPGETHSSIRDTINFALNNPFDRVWFNILTPYPGSEIFEELIKIHKLSFKEIPWDSLDGNTELIAVGELSPSEIEEYQKIAARRFYLRPKILLSVISKWGPKEVKTLLMTRFFRKVIRI